MFSKRKARLIVFATAVVALGGGLFAYVAPASTNVNPAATDVRPGIAGDATIEPWSTYLSNEAVDARGIEGDLDGNAASLYPSDWLRAPGVR